MIRIVAVNVPTTARGWQLYEDERGVEEVAQQLGAAAEKCAREALEKKLKGCELYSAFKPVRVLMSTYAKFGACDSEPGHVLDDIMDRIKNADRRR